MCVIGPARGAAGVRACCGRVPRRRDRGGGRMSNASPGSPLMGAVRAPAAGFSAFRPTPGSRAGGASVRHTTVLRAPATARFPGRTAGRSPAHPLPHHLMFGTGFHRRVGNEPPGGGCEPAARTPHPAPPTDRHRPTPFHRAGMARIIFLRWEECQERGSCAARSSCRLVEKTVGADGRGTVRPEWRRRARKMQFPPLARRRRGNSPALLLAAHQRTSYAGL